MGFNSRFKGLKSGKINVSLPEDPNSFITCRSVLRRMRNVSDRFVEEFKTHILRSVIILSDNRAVDEIM